METKSKLRAGYQHTPSMRRGVASIRRALAAVCAVCLAAAACQAPASEPAPDAAGGAAGGEQADVMRVADGDTLAVSLGGAEQTVRLIGIDAPEAGECLADRARERLAELAPGRVRLETDSEGRDRYGRLLVYLWADGVLVNEALAAEGLALARAYPPNTARQAALQTAEDAARRARLGLWAPDACGAPTGLDLEITEIRWNPPGPDEDDLNGEYLVIVNRADRPADLGGFTLRDESSSNRYRFPPGLILPARGRAAVHSGSGRDRPGVLYWGSGRPIWNNGGDRAFLLDPAGNITAEYSYRG